MTDNTSLSASLEDYIEAISHVIAEKKVARGKEIASRLKVSQASVTEALRALAKKGLINYAPYELITLTSRGEEIAADVIWRHAALKDFFVKVLDVDEKTAEEGACRIEHAAPPEIIERLIRFVKFLENCPRGGTTLLQGFADFCEKDRTAEKCRVCVATTLERAGKI